MSLRKWIGVLFTFVLLVGWGVDHSSAQAEVLQIGINPVEPFVVFGDEPVGFSIDLWTALANEADIEFEFVQLANVGALLKAVQNGQVDAGIGATSITAERERVVDFSLPFFAAGLQIMAGAEAEPGIFDTLESIFTPNFVRVILGSFLILLIIAHIAYFIERDENPAFDGGYFHGIWVAFYWTVITASTVGYGDAVLKDNRGRLLAIVWILLSIFLVSFFTATVTTSLTLGRLNAGITGPDDLRGNRIITLPDTTSASYLEDRGIAFRPIPDVEAAVQELSDGSADAFIYDAPVLQFYANQNSAENIRLAPTVFQPESYGIVLPQGSPLREDVNQALLRLFENGVYDKLQERWFGEQ